MKTLFPALSASLVLNLVLAGLLSRKGDAKPAEPARPPAVRTVEKPTSSPTQPAWEALAVGDHNVSATIKTLRQHGFPEDMITSLVSAVQKERFERRRRELYPPDPSLPFWKSLPKNAAADAELAKFGRELDEEAVLALGHGLNDLYYTMVAQRGLEQLAPERRERVSASLMEFSARKSTILSGAEGTTGRREKYLAVENEERAYLASVLSPEEFKQYELGFSASAANTRIKLTSFNPTQEEFERFFALQRDIDARLGTHSDGSREEALQRMTEQQKQDAAFLATLSPERATQYLKAQDGNYRATATLTERLGLGSQAADRLYAIQKEYESAASTPGAQPALERANAAMAKLAQELPNKEQLDLYLAYAGKWLPSKLNPRK